MKKLCYHPRFKKMGFTLLELMVVVVLLAGLLAIIIPALSSISSADIKNEAVTIAGLSHEVYARAAISGVTHRLNIDLDNQKYWVEAKEGDAGLIAPEMGYDELMKSLQAKGEKEAQQSPEYKYVPHYKAAEGVLGQINELGRNIVFYGAWTEQMTEVARSGIVSIYFFSGGYTQSAFVSLAQKDDEKDSAIYLALSPLTGSVSINFGEPNIQDLLEGESEKEN